MKNSLLALLIVGRSNLTALKVGREICSLCRRFPEKEKAAHIAESGVAFSSATYKSECKSKGDILQRIILISEGDANHV